MTQENMKRMLEISLEKKSLLIKILELTKVQGDTIDKEQIEDLDRILIQKEKLMEEIDNLDREFLSNYNSIKSAEGIDSLDKIDIQKYASLKSLKEAVAEINTILNEISSIDRNNTIKMKSQVDKIKSDLKQVKQAKRAYKGYNYEAVESILIDEKK